MTQLAPSDKWGYAIMAGIVLNLPWAKGDQFWIEGAYTVGAVSYTGWNQNGQYSNFQRFNGDNVAAAGRWMRCSPTSSARRLRSARSMAAVSN